MNANIRKLTRGAIIAALYFLFSVAFGAISFGAVQFRLSEALVALVIILPEAAWGVTLGCLLANLLSPFGIIDVIIGTSVTALACFSVYFFRKKRVFALAFPVVMNAIFIPLVWVMLGTEQVYLLNVLYIFVSEAVIVYGVGLSLLKIIEKRILL